MLKNFLVSKVSVLALTAIVLHSLIVPVWSMSEEDDENSNSATTIKGLCERYNITSPQDQDILSSFYEGKLVFRPNPESDEGKIELPIAALTNPLEGEFDLSKCGDAGKYLSINTGYRKGFRPENVEKTEIWFTPRFLVDRELPTMAENHYLRKIITSGYWDAARAPIGIFWTRGGWNAKDQMAYCDYLTTESIEGMGSVNLYKKYGGLAVGGGEREPNLLSAASCESWHDMQAFHISFVN